MPPLSSGITLSQAGVTLAGKPVLQDLTARLTEARIGIIGRNGSGKTTLLRLIAGLIAPDKGMVRLDGFDPFADRKAALSALGILFQNPDHQILFPTVAEEIAFGLRQLGQTEAAAQAAALQMLARHGRSHWAKAATHTLSQGQRHYLCLMAVLAMAPSTILLDEPFAGLDLPSQMQLQRGFAALPQRLITITHDPAVVAGYDRILWLQDGRLHADGPPAQILPAFHAAMAAYGACDADTDISG
ncbi:MAG: energy-coupling factor ABC transporter ATP-binding protein [Rhodobacteraceae bacterium]|jgi:biotin transport system ATP-binding protein|nr:energy-coupling factor ABC transporter ATP-binding protein [Paracoccaceae bacterium]